MNFDEQQSLTRDNTDDLSEAVKDNKLDHQFKGMIKMTTMMMMT